ncbi:HAD family hydrolase [Rudaeicoccus suwonensis]|uniref:Putative hydrolase of the HAD superfamily n=1 Tax=Rudaeicoccus suwonensis TaxID=657409 RepID=A0A561E3E5_9MICO|nr:HAD family phosphatase [Rudaeicoccus suwonensis]TWE10119.1 putative hydrolase of the HAD superfamily [Rudaeicoccus suwonensis]
MTQRASSGCGCDHDAMITVVLFDLDGVVRHFDPRHVVAIEQRHDLPRGAIEAVAFSSPLIDEVTTGRVSRQQWIQRIGERLGKPVAAQDWGAQPFVADGALLALADELRAAGRTTAILTNGTDTISAESETLGLPEHFDHIFNSADIGYAKPDQRAFEHVLRALDVAADAVFFTDDSEAKLAGATSLGMTTQLFTDVVSLRNALRESGVPVATARRTTRSFEQ